MYYNLNIISKVTLATQRVLLPVFCVSLCYISYGIEKKVYKANSPQKTIDIDQKKDKKSSDVEHVAMVLNRNSA